ncbi:unnamed protein product [Closterium sp. NIES-53]
MYREAVSRPWASEWKAAMDSELVSWRSTGTYVDAVPPPRVNVVDGIWLFKVKRPPGSPPVFKARYVARGFSQREGVDFFQTFAPTPKMTTLRVLLHVFFHVNYVSEDMTKIRYAVSLLRGHAMDWWRVIVTKPMDYATLPTREGQTGPWAPSYFVDVPQYRTWDAWCAGLRARFEPIAASIAAHQKLHTWRQLGSVQDYTSRFLALCKQVGYMHESERIDRYIGGLKHDIPQEIQLRCVTDFQEILAMAEKLDFFRRPCPGSYGSNNNWGHQSRGMNKGATIRAVVANAAAAPFKGRCFACNQPGHRKSECPENAKGKGEAKQQKQTKQQGNAGSQ